jgi:hypothetical protein
MIIFNSIITMGGTCCTTRDRAGLEDDPSILIPIDKRSNFQKEILKAVDKDKLHAEVLEQQNVLDFETYKNVISLVTVYVAELTLIRSQRTFP